jgi:hypothetical protein
MVLRYAVANGNWSNPATWDGGTLPGNGDDVYTDGKTVTIDIDLVGTYRPARLFSGNRGGGTNGGTFNVSTTIQIGELGNPVDIFGSDVDYSSTINFYGITGTTLTIYGNVSGGAYALSFGVRNNSTGTITINGNVSGGTASYDAYGALNNSSGTITINGNVSGGTGTYVYGVRNNSTGTIIINGNVFGGSGNTAHGVLNNSSGTITINGNVSGVNGYNAHGAFNNSSGTITINGNVFGGFGGYAYGVTNGSSGTITINGNVSGGGYHWQYGNIYGVVNSSIGIITINGNIQPTATGQAAIAVCNNSTGYITINGDVYGGRGATAVFANNGYIRINGSLKWDATYSDSPAVDSSNNAVIVLNGDVRHHYGTTGLYGMTLARGRITMLNGNNHLTTYAESDGNGPGVTGNPVYHDGAARAASNFPTPANVRYGTIYGPANEYTGTCRVPPKEAVAAGTPVDNTVGIAVLTQNDIIQAVWHGENVEAGGFTPFKALRVIAAACGGKISGSGTGQVVIKAANDSDTTRITADVDNDGNRLNVTFNV